MTDHDPMLDGIQRWSVETEYLTQDEDSGYGIAQPDEGGDFVKVSSLSALIAKVREDAWSERWTTNTEAYDMGYAKGRDDAARDVAGLPCDSYYLIVSRQTVIAVARGGSDD